MCAEASKLSRVDFEIPMPMKNMIHSITRSDNTGMLCPKCNFEQEPDNRECPRCGIVFSKYKGTATSGPKPQVRLSEETRQSLGKTEFVKNLLFDVEPDIPMFHFAGRSLLFLGLVILGSRFAFTSLTDPSYGGSLLHLINLPFHEAGHIFFRPLGRFMTSIGGSLGQLLMPFVCLTALLVWRRDAFGASVCLWWFGENFVDLAPYINDARALSLPLLGGNTGRTAPYGFHDWEYILKEMGLLRYDHLLAGISHKLGICLMALAVAWSVYILFLQYRNLDRPS